MTISLESGGVTLPLHPDLLWADENDWYPVEQTTERTITGALIVSAATRLAGRPITLQPEDESSAWMRYSSVTQLRNWAAVPGLILQLTLRGTTRSVAFRHEDVGISASPVTHFSDVLNTDFYRVTLRFLEV